MAVGTYSYDGSAKKKFEITETGNLSHCRGAKIPHVKQKLK